MKQGIEPLASLTLFWLYEPGRHSNFNKTRDIPRTSFKKWANAEFEFGRHRDIAGVVEAVQVCAQDESILDVIRGHSEVGLDVGGIQDGLRVFPRDRTTSLVSGKQFHFEGGLSLSSHNGALSPGARVTLDDSVAWLEIQDRFRMRLLEKRSKPRSGLSS